MNETLAPLEETKADRIASNSPSEQTDKWVENVQFRLPPEELRKLSTLNPWVSILHIGLEWLGIIGAIWLCSHYWSIWLYIPTVMWIGARQHALLILMHEGTHYRLFKNKRLNDFVSEVFLAWPNFITARAYRVSHFAHHRHISTDDDPDWVRKKNHEWEFPKSWADLGRILLKDVFGLNTHQLIAEVTDLADTPEKESKPPRGYTLARVAFYLTALAAVIYFQWFLGFLLFWLIPFGTWFKMIIRIRGIAEHYGLDDAAYGLTRTTILSWFDKLFVAPNNINYHLEHHLYPSVPFFRLPRLHKKLMENSAYQQQAHVTQTYWGVLRECVNAGGKH